MIIRNVYVNRPNMTFIKLFTVKMKETLGVHYVHLNEIQQYFLLEAIILHILFI